MPIYKLKNQAKNGLQKYKVRVSYTSRDGKHKQISKNVFGKEAAQIAEYELLKHIQENDVPFLSKMTFLELYEEYMKVKKYEVRESTLEKKRRMFRNYILPKLKNYQLDKLGSRILLEWKLYVEEKTLQLATKQDSYSQIRALLNYAVKMEYIQSNPVLKVGNFVDPLARKKQVDFYTADEFKLFINAAKQSAIDYEAQYNSYYEWNFYVFFNIAFYTGLRKGEIHGLRWEDIDGEYLSVQRSISQKLKTGVDVETPPKNIPSIRTIQMPLPLIKILKEHKKRRPDKNLNILGDGRSLRDSSLQNKSKVYAKMAGIKRIRIHDFRHSHASLLANMGINIQEVARRLGHSKIEMTWNTYSHLYPREEEKAMEVLNKV